MDSNQILDLARRLAQDLSAPGSGRPGSEDESVSRAELRPAFVHLSTHKNPALTVELLRALPRSPYAKRSKKTSGQYARVERLLVPLLQRKDASPQVLLTLLGWTGRFLEVIRLSQKEQAPANGGWGKGGQGGRGPHGGAAGGNAPGGGYGRGKGGPHRR